MSDFLSFKRFITPDVLILVYYFGAILMPILAWATHRYLIRRLGFTETRRRLIDWLGQRNRLLLVLTLVAVFLMMELAWRMMFEMMIGYFQMHDYLRILSTKEAGV